MIAACIDAFDADSIRRLGDAGVTHYATAPWILYGGSWDSLQDKTRRPAPLRRRSHRQMCEDPRTSQPDFPRSEPQASGETP